MNRSIQRQNIQKEPKSSYPRRVSDSIIENCALPRQPRTTTNLPSVAWCRLALVQRKKRQVILHVTT
jgi:hypothetical protein